MAEGLGVYPLGIIGHSHVTVLPLGETLLQRGAKEKVKCSRCTLFWEQAREAVGYFGYSTITVSITLDTTQWEQISNDQRNFGMCRKIFLFRIQLS